ncbi:S-adenosyl-L-methionine-dependent methyltransferase [Longimycelium tulufanense]|uniref:S-adenosyl-L-methionine-dependent methyltransferase n=1 Tax=Longimycelium tulufanense TaxID=907463 RepID=A0A8J3FXR0_9PSEU|nr:SAM-dependent methyltransferase [Longimycelium tulufanense]GGM70428.1 S-adenosyl-L-methionine-dependent methyltransferase [Longimycelium tulufanense]
MEGVGVTSLLVALARAAESRRPDRLFVDPYAAEFAAAVPEVREPPMEEGARRSALADYLAVRTRFFDDSLVEAACAGCGQIVQLGAGLDTRGFRLNWPAGTRLFEIDQPEVLTFKDSVLRRCAAQPRCERRTVPADLDSDWITPLRDAGFDPDQPTGWAAEGILYYLSPETNDRVMRTVADAAAMGSRLVVEHVTRHVTRSETMSRVRADLASRAAEWRSFVDEPMTWLRWYGWHVRLFTPNELLAASGRRLLAENGGPPNGWLAVCER